MCIILFMVQVRQVHNILFQTSRNDHDSDFRHDHILEFAKEKQIEGMVYLSSLEVYGTPDHTHTYISEKDYGYIEQLSVRSS